ncbi:MAG: phosphoenolpyruvate synthase, partial [Chloroflexota bacterium]|nr:phosphoenolpyruvate synthase [Chloroflexota bacterium]
MVITSNYNASGDSLTEGNVNKDIILPFSSESVSLATAGGKGANLARLVHGGFPVPSGFIVTTEAYDAFVAANELGDVISKAVRQSTPDDPASLESISATIRARFAAGKMPATIAGALQRAYQALGMPPVAVRSSATAEDLPEMSFAGQQDTFLNVVGQDALQEAVVNCWSSLWTARAIGYRARNGIPHEEVSLAVVVQEMVPSEASGVLFTANPLNGKRTEMVIDATLGLGEALVAGRVEPDHYLVDVYHKRILSKRLGSKALAIHGQEGGGTLTTMVEAADRQALPDDAILELARQGQQVAELFGTPQDIEWAWAAGQLYLLQSRPITSLYPLPDGMPMEPLRVLFSFGAIQGMLDPMTPLGQDTIAAAFAGAARLFGYERTIETQRVIFRAGERLWADLTAPLRNGLGRALLRRALPAAEPSIGQVVNQLWDDPRLAPTRTLPQTETIRHIARVMLPVLGRVAASLLWPDANRRRAQRRLEEQVAEAEARSVHASTLHERVGVYEAVLDEAFTVALPHVLPRILAGMAPLLLLNHLAASMRSSHLVLELTRGLPHNVTTEMDLVLWDAAHTIKSDADAAHFFAQHDAAALAAAYQEGALPEV